MMLLMMSGISYRPANTHDIKHIITAVTLAILMWMVNDAVSASADSRKSGSFVAAGGSRNGSNNDDSNGGSTNKRAHNRSEKPDRQLPTTTTKTLPRQIFNSRCAASRHIRVYCRDMRWVWCGHWAVDDEWSAGCVWFIGWIWIRMSVGTCCCWGCWVVGGCCDSHSDSRWIPWGRIILQGMIGRVVSV